MFCQQNLHLLSPFGSQLPGSHSSADRRSGPVLPVALSTWILTEPLPFLRQELEPWTQGSAPKNPDPRGSEVPEMYRTREHHHVSLGMHAKSSNYLSVSFDTNFSLKLSNSMDHLIYDIVILCYISFLKGAPSKMNLCIGFREFGPTEGIEHPRATLHHQCMGMPRYA